MISAVKDVGTKNSQIIPNHDDCVEECLDRERRKGARRGRRTRHARRVGLPSLFEQLPQILKHGVFFVGAHAISEKELLAQV